MDHYDGCVVAVAALAAWSVNVAIGLTMLVRWQGARPRTVWVHLPTASLGLALWVTFLATGRPTELAWAAFLVMIGGNVLGDMLLMQGWRHRGGTGAGPRAYVAAAVDVLTGKRTATWHATFAGVTFVLVLLAALGV